MFFKTCKYCEATNLAWKFSGGKWFLIDKSGNKHICAKYTNPAIPKQEKKLEFKNDPLINKALKIFKKQLDRQKKK